MVTDFSLARHQLVDYLRREVRDERVLAAMSRVPREMFVPSGYWHAAYEDRPLPIGHGQTISQPLIVAMMTEALDLEGDENVLEVGTGGGFRSPLPALNWCALRMAIVVSAGAPTVPKDLLDQLAMGGRLIIPVGPRHEQNLLKVMKKEHGTTIEDLGPCRWVPLIGDAAWSEENA